MEIAFLCTFFCEKDTNHYIFLLVDVLISSLFFPQPYLPGFFSAKIFTVGSYSTDCTELYTSLSIRVHIFVNSWKLLFLKTIIWDKIVIYLFKSWSNILCKILCIHSIKIEGLVLEKTCRYKEINCGVPQGSVLGPISYLAQKENFKNPWGEFSEIIENIIWSKFQVNIWLFVRGTFLPIIG